MKNILYTMLFIIFPFLVSAQDNIDFDEINSSNYDKGILYIEIKTYFNNQELIKKSKQNINELPIIILENNNAKDINYSFRGYVTSGYTKIEVMDVRVKFTNDIDSINILDGLKTAYGDLQDVLNNVGNEEFISSSGKDNYGEFTIVKNLFVDTSDEIEEKFKMYYALIVYFNLDYINEEKISRQLYYYLMEFSY